MRAIRVIDWGRPAELVDVPAPEPRGEELVIKVEAAGLCGSDLHLADASADAFAFDAPFTLGHEVAGIVVATGPDADSSWIGVSVVVHGVWSCGTCRNCLRGRENYCFELRRRDGRGSAIGAGIGRDGGLAERILVPSTRVLVRTDGLDPAVAAPLADAGLTAFHALSAHDDLLDARAVVIVVGVGGLGHLALQLLRHRGVGTIIAIDSSPSARELALVLGADYAFSAFGEMPSVLDDTDGHGGADVVLDFVGAAQTPAEGLAQLAPGGRLVVVGSGGARLTVGKDLGLDAGWQVGAPFWGTRAELEAVIALARGGHLHVETTRCALEDVPAFYERLRAGEVHGRVVALPHGPVSGATTRSYRGDAREEAR
jgi:propanol-preferring alcohol dehydrogenase